MSDRANRLRERRQQSADKIQDKTGESSELSKPDETGETDEGAKPSVKDEQEGTYFYLPGEQKRELSYQFKRLSAEFEREFGDDLEKNRHFYPLVIQYGLDRLDGSDVHDVRELLDGLNY